MKPSDVDVNKSFTELGLDSIVGVEWVKSINKQYGTALSATRVYDHPSVKELASHLVTQMPATERAPLVCGPQAIRFEPKDAKACEQLYFHSAAGEGDFDREGEFSVRCAIDPDTNVCLAEHIVFGEHLLPTDAYIELVYSAYRTFFSPKPLSLKKIAIANPMLGAKGTTTHVKVVFRRAGDELQFFVKSSRSTDFRHDKLHMQGFIGVADDTPSSRFDEAFAVEKTLAADEIATNTGHLLCAAAVAAPRCVIGARRHPRRQRTTSPSWRTRSPCTAACARRSTTPGIWRRATTVPSDDQFLPYRIGRIAVLGPLDDRDYRCRAQVRAFERDSVAFDFEIVDRSDRPVLVVEAIQLRRVARQTLQQQASPATRLPAVQDRPASNGAGARTEQVAIIGMSCRYPMAEDADAFWENLKAGRDCVTEVPPDRWGADATWYHPDPRHAHTSYSKWGGFLDRIDQFDAAVLRHFARGSGAHRPAAAHLPGGMLEDHRERGVRAERAVATVPAASTWAAPAATTRAC